MTIEYTSDEDDSMYIWKKLEGSEDYNLKEYGLIERNDDGEYDEGSFEECVAYLQKVTPHIAWRATDDGMEWDSGVGNIKGKQWRVMCVPRQQYPEAEYILDRYLKGDDLTDYSNKDKYPDIYVLINGEKQIKPEIEHFFESLSKYSDLLANPGKYKLKELFEELVIILSKIYSLAYELAEVDNAIDFSYLGDFGSIGTVNLDLGIYDTFFYLEDPFKRDVQDGLLSDMIISIYENLEQWLLAFYENDLFNENWMAVDVIAAAINDCRNGFLCTHNWGDNILVVISTIRCALRDMEEKEN